MEIAKERNMVMTDVFIRSVPKIVVREYVSRDEKGLTIPKYIVINLEFDEGKVAIFVNKTTASEFLEYLEQAINSAEVYEI